ncbi:right-handed parallel beta-helix repeat-containing protein, partial [Candidatus Woesearchaeota archaeon]|nr:right-handed parallel beta-helix repeat-containing protein [Candidatus Woesearchaeota archaeon]
MDSKSEKVSVSLFKPTITGFMVLQESNPIGIEFTSNMNLTLPINDITALYLNSFISSNFSGKVSLYDGNDRYTLLDYSILDLNEEVENSSIEFELNYNKISPEVAELSVAAEQYSCVEWKINDENICYGENSCCSLLNLESSGEKNESLYLNKWKYNAQDRNIVKAQVVYANYSLDIDDAYSDIRYSDIKGIVVDLFDKLPLSNVCGEACNLEGGNNYALEIIVESGSIEITNYTYQLTPNNAPEFKEVPNVTFSDSYTLDLSKYVSDKENNELNIGYLHVDGISVEFNGLTAIIRADSNFTGKAYTFFTVNDSSLSATSNIIELEVVDFKPKVVVGEDVRWVKKASVIDNKVILEHEPINITVTAEGEEILDRNVDIIIEGERKDLDEYEYDKKIEKLDEGINSASNDRKVAFEEEKSDFVKSKRLENTGRALRKLISITGNVVLNEEEADNTVLVINEDVQEVEIEYFTEAPIAIEEEMNNGKRVTISSDIGYEDVLAFADIPDTDANSIKLFHIVNGTKKLSNFDGYDSNDNNLVDYIEWTVPHLSNQTYEIILITEAEHLDENRNFVNDVYDYVKARDYNFTTIPASNYIRVKFERRLNSNNDITIYAKSNHSNASVFVYEKDKNDSIADFGTITDYGKYQILLTNLNESQDIFDLRTTNDVEFDYVVDPTTVSACGTLSTSNTQYDLTQNIASANGPCINIAANNITFDGHGYRITYGGGGTGIGINVTNSANVTIRGANVYKNLSNTATASNYGILLSNARNSTISNVTVRTNGTSANFGIYFSSSNQNIVTTSNITTGGDQDSNYGIFITDSSFNNNVTLSSIVSSGRVSNDWAVYIGTASNTISSNNITASGGGSTYGIYMSTASSSTITSNIITSNDVGIRADGNNAGSFLRYNTIKSGGIGLYLYSRYNTFVSNVINNSGTAIYLYEDSPAVTINNKFINTSIISVDGIALDLNTVICDGCNLSGNEFIDTPIRNYSITNPGGLLYFNDSRYGEIRFLKQINGSGSNLSHAIRINSNSIFVNASLRPGLNRSANVTVYNLPISSGNVAILKDNTVCDSSTSPTCNILQPLNRSTARFNVTEWSEYSVDVTSITVSSCQALNTNNMYYDLIEDISSVTGCIEVNASNITFDGHGHTITYGTGGKGQGINATNKVNITIKSAIIAKGSESDANNYGILLSEVENSTIINNTIRTNG